MKYRKPQSGFTIIELMIATLIFSIILLVVTAGILQFSKQYYKGIISSTTQSTARTLIDDLARSIEFNGGGVIPLNGGGYTGFCVGTAKRYSYALNRQVTDSPPLGAHQSLHGLVSDTVSGCTSSATPPLNVASGLPQKLNTGIIPPLVNPRELLGEHMRLSKFVITQNTDTYTVSVRVVYGDDDLLCSPKNNDCNLTTMSSALDTADDLSCKSIAGSEYCAVSELSTTVNKRVN